MVRNANRLSSRPFKAVYRVRDSTALQNLINNALHLPHVERSRLQWAIDRFQCWIDPGANQSEIYHIQNLHHMPRGIAVATPEVVGKFLKEVRSQCKAGQLKSINDLTTQYGISRTYGTVLRAAEYIVKSPIDTVYRWNAGKPDETMTNEIMDTVRQYNLAQA